MVAIMTDIDSLDGQRLSLALKSGIRRLLSRQEHLNKINVFPVPDGDTGTNLALTMTAVLPTLRAGPSGEAAHAGEMLTRVADAALDGARGNSGAILAQFFLGLGDKAGHLREITVRDFAVAVQGGAEYARESLAEPREGTILTVLTEFAAEVRAQALSHGVSDFRRLFSRTLPCARASLEATRLQLESLRRANVVDAGAQGFVELLEGMSEYIETGRVDEDVSTLVAIHDDEQAAGQEENLTHRYCTECVVSGEAVDRRHLREELAAVGSSLVVAGTLQKARVHVHVNDPDAVFRLAERYGKVTAQKADDMQRQQESVHHVGRRKVAVVIDSAADLPDEALERLDIHMIPVRIHFGDHSYLDKVSLTPEQFFRLLVTHPEHPKTSQPPPGDFRRAYEFLASHYESVLYVGLTSRASGTFQSGQSAAERVHARGRIAAIDSQNVSLGQGMIAMRAAEAAAAGASLEECERIALAARGVTRSFACLTTLEYAIRGGRIPAWAGTAARLCGVTPLIGTRVDGTVGLVGVLFGQHDLTERFGRWVRRQMKPGRRWRLAVAHANVSDEAARLVEVAAGGRGDVEAAAPIPLGTALGVHGGPGSLVASIQEVLPTDRPATT